MSNKQRGLLVIFIFVMATMLISACTQSLSSVPEATPTLIPTGLFVSPLPSVENPMAMIEEFAKQTAAAQTAAAGGTPGTPQAITTGTVSTQVVGTVTPVPATNTPGTPTNVASTPTNASGATVATPIPAGAHPQEYILKKEEFPYCIARRFGVDPEQLVYNQSALYFEGLVIQFPANIGGWPASAGPIALNPHPANYTVTGNSDTTVYGVACKFGNVDPSEIATLNSISVSSALTVGQVLKIP